MPVAAQAAAGLPSTPPARARAARAVVLPEKRARDAAPLAAARGGVAAHPLRQRSGGIFVCAEETLFYSECLRQLVFDRAGARAGRTIVEFGTGDGTAVIRAVQASRQPCPVVTGFEISGEAAAAAQANVASSGVTRVQVRHGCFFEGVAKQAPSVLVANPPYLPAPDSDILLPTLFGGSADGGAITRDLLSLDVEEVMLLIPSYSDPLKTMRHAAARNYAVASYLATEMPFGTYSREPKVFDWIQCMRADGRAFTRADSYRLLGVLFKKRLSNGNGVIDLAGEVAEAFRGCQ